MAAHDDFGKEVALRILREAMDSLMCECPEPEEDEDGPKVEVLKLGDKGKPPKGLMDLIKE